MHASTEAFRYTKTAGKKRSPLLRLLVVLVSSMAIVIPLLHPNFAGAATLSVKVQPILAVKDAQVVTRGDFLKAAVALADLPLTDTEMMPYENVPQDLVKYVRAAQKVGALKAFGTGKDLQLIKPIRRGEALGVLVAVTQSTASGTGKDALKKYADVRSAQEIDWASIAVDKGWMKPLNETMFGLKQYLRGKEAKLALARAFKIPVPTNNTDMMSAPVIRLKLQTTSGGPAPKSDVMEQVWHLLTRDFLYKDKLDYEKAGSQAIQGLVNSLGDPYTTYMPKQVNEDFKLQMQGEVEGIGATVEMTGGILTVVSPITGSPAERAGLLPKDQIISVDGVTLSGMVLDEAVRKVRGPKDSTGLFHVRRGGNEFDISIKREKITIPEVQLSEDRGVQIVKILQFWDATDKKFRGVMAEVEAKHPRGIILDLRNNPGGLLHAADVVVSAFLPKDSVYVSILERDNTSQEKTTEEPVVTRSIPMAILVNGGSASASEIVAGALQDAKRATLVGLKTYGKGTVQQVAQLPDGSSLKYTVAEWHTPLDRKINKLGIDPDVVVENKDKATDLQMQKAMEIVLH